MAANPTASNQSYRSTLISNFRKAKSELKALKNWDRLDYSALGSHDSSCGLTELMLLVNCESFDLFVRSWLLFAVDLEFISAITKSTGLSEVPCGPPLPIPGFSGSYNSEFRTVAVVAVAVALLAVIEFSFSLGLGSGGIGISSSSSNCTKSSFSSSS
uniref:Uncharacterized protein n=1 Tax=Glossina pallidipes TaxID=7398 RepID=A0A1A9ZVM3_GLOPL